MPNWCENELTVLGGDPHELLDFSTKLWSSLDEDGHFHLLEKFVPMPEKYVDTVSGSASIEVRADDDLNWYDWCVANWSCKWPDSETSAQFGEDQITLRFLTPWAPPQQGITLIVKQFPTLRFVCRWSEEGGESGEFEVVTGPTQ